MTPKRHLLIIDDSRGRHEHTLDLPVHTVGRSLDASINIASQFASRRHATLIKIYAGKPEETYLIVDGALSGKRSANGIEVNGEKTLSRNLQNGDQILFASQVKAVYYQINKDEQNKSPDGSPHIESTLVKDRDNLV